MPVGLGAPLQVGESLKRFGVLDDTQHILVASFHTGHQDVRMLSAYCELEADSDTVSVNKMLMDDRLLRCWMVS